ncbi:TPA: hypothetical protein ACFK6Y_05765 [Neisseria gonorrhoeae]|nr:hypothetical protein EGH13_00660 [Neisseria gonorrhoeae]ROU90046.1 hypothetical protein EGO82_02465 [Neisseria gonorrhoeae]ROV23346.1 hypothetical protein EGP41_03450 [Neisseria gonorrhoeae]TJW73401.1 hypothetical protein E8M72_06120 [Neisseria gonorrhoeae]TJX09309.1 hypothetical protein E8M62_05030 [Neisseria gonorrhoeae]
MGNRRNSAVSVFGEVGWNRRAEAHPTVHPTTHLTHLPYAFILRLPICRHSRTGGNLEPQRGRNLSDTAETERTGFPPARE